MSELIRGIWFEAIGTAIARRFRYDIDDTDWRVAMGRLLADRYPYVDEFTTYLTVPELISALAPECILRV